MFESLQLFSTRINSDLFVPRHLEQFVIFSIKAPALDLGFRSLCCHATEGCIELFLTVHVKMRLAGLIFILPRENHDEIGPMNTNKLLLSITP